MNTKALLAGMGLAPKAPVQQRQDLQRDGVRLVGSQRQQRVGGRHARHRSGVMQYAESLMELHCEAQRNETVGDVMTSPVISVSPETTVLEALGMIVKHRITGMPVVDKAGKVVGVVSDYDLLALDMASLDAQGMFPSLDQSWQAFREVRTLMSKVEGKTVEDVMTTDPVVVRPNTSLEMAARLLLESKIRRLPVLDKDGKLVGLLSRRNIVVAALEERELNGEGSNDTGPELLA